VTRRGERGQAIVVIALIVAVLCGMLGLAIDGGRGFIARRELQNAADASADAAAVTYARTLDYAQAETAQVVNYQTNRAIAGSYSCSPSIPQVPDAGQTVALRCTFPSDSSQAMEIAVTNRPDPVNVIQFWTGGAQSLATALIQIVGAGPNFPVSAQGVAWWTPSAYPSGPYGFGTPPGTGPYGNPPPGWTGPWPPGSSGGPPPAPPSSGSIPPVVLALSGACGSGNNALSLTEDVPHTWPATIGNVVSYGNVVGTVTNSAGASVPVAADTTAYCSAPSGVVGWCYPSGQAPGTNGCTGGSVFQYGKPAPPNYPLQPVDTTLPTGIPGTSVILEPGLFPQPAVFGSPAVRACSFLSAGVYRFQSQFQAPNGVLSNELRPPDEPATGSADAITTVQSPQFWDLNGAKCAGHYGISDVLDVPGPSLPAPANGVPLSTGSYAVRVTSVRQDNGKTRESSPSICRTSNFATPGALQVSISNVPGATAYNVYLSTVSINAALTESGVSVSTPGGTCAGLFYFLGQLAVPNPQLETNADTSGCPSLTQTATCSLGVTIGAFDQTQLNQIINLIRNGQVPPPPPIPCVQALAVNCASLNVPELQAPAAPGLADRDPVIGTDLANWGYYTRILSSCQQGVAAPNTAAGYNPSCWVTPGAVQIQETSGQACLDFSSGASSTPSGAADFLFSGYQYAWAVALQPTADGSCADYFSGAFGTEFLGHVSVPQAAGYVSGNNGAVPAVSGSFTAYQVYLGSTSGLAVSFIPPPDSTIGYGVPVM